MADAAGVAVQELLQQSLREEERMAEWVDNNVQSLTIEYLRKSEFAAA
jgi:ferritin-like metal-binding protein YciE